MPKDNNIRSFRITPESERILEQLKQEKKISNTSEFINQLICTYVKPQPAPRDVSDLSASVRTIPEKAVSTYLSGGSIEENIRLNSIPFCHMNIKRHSEAKKIIEQNGMGYFYFPVNDDISMAIIACKREEASIQFQQYYLYDNESRRYVRTSAPLPQYRFDSYNKNIIIIEANNQPLKNHPSVWAEKGCWNWVLKDAVLFDKPIENVKGKLSFWEYEFELVKQKINN